MVYISTSKTRAKGQRVVAGKRDMDELRRRRDSIKRALANEKDIKSYNPSSFVMGNKDRQGLVDELRRVERTIENKAPRKQRGGDKDRLNKITKQLEQKISEGMPTKSEMWDPTQDNIYKHQRWQDINMKRCKIYRNIKRTLEPDDPGSGSVEKLRPKT